ncbi:proline-specific peptidase [Wolfiporia cocos MD-104 SS10]|uniref:Proline-specific peptidase n=1 Tax=Wolfiporia cocos (strain MD-104) TaxID=742152 RepID=A0A2H3JC06_WOLCO|nr:proline-specific peptidase [Wolfiporia cocos MD-104 SS10]
MTHLTRSCNWILALFSSLTCLNGVTDVEKVAVSEGTVPFAYGGETYQTYYKVYGDLANGAHTPLVVIHGGPGVSHDYMLPISDLATRASVPVIFYDQIGGARSTHLRSKPANFWTIDLFVGELDNLLSYLSIRESFDLIGHSWGGVIGAEYEVRRQPAGLQHLILSDSLASEELWGRSTAQLLEAFPTEVQEGIAAGMSEPKRFEAAMRKFNEVHGCTVKPTPKELVYSLDQIFGESGDTTVASANILSDWSIVERLHFVTVPTLIINGGSDVAQDFVVAPFYERIPDVKWITFQNSSHMPFWEERERYIDVLLTFLSL